MCIEEFKKLSKEKQEEYLRKQKHLEEERSRNQYRPSPPHPSGSNQSRHPPPQQSRYPPPQPPPPQLRRPKMEDNNYSRSPAQTPSGDMTPTYRSVTPTPSDVNIDNQGMNGGSDNGSIHQEIPGEKDVQQDNSGRTNFNNIDSDLDDTAEDPSSDQNYTYTMTNTDIDNLLPEAGTDNYHKLIGKQSKENLKSLNHFKDLSEALNNILNTAHYSTSQFDESRKAVKDNYKSLKDSIREEEDKLKDASALSNKFRQILQQPVFGANIKINIEEARLAVPLFSDETDSSNLQEFWQKLVSYAETEKLSETSVKNLLSFLLQGRPYRAFYQNKEKSLQEICKIFIDRFGSVTTMSDKIKDLESICRKDKESIRGTMSRVAELIDATQLLVKESDRQVRYEILMTNNLLKLASSKAKQACLNHRSRALRSGIISSYKELLGIACEMERQENNSNDSELYAFPVMRAEKHMRHREKPYGEKPVYDKYKPPAPSPSPASSAPAHAAPYFRSQSSNSKPFKQRYGSSDHKNINDHYRKNPNMNRNHNYNQKDFRPAYKDNYQYNNYNRQWDNHGGRPSYDRNFRPKIYQGYGNYARHKYPPYPMGCGVCGLYHYGRCHNNYQNNNNYNKNNRNDLN